MRILYATDGSEGGLSPARFLASLPPHQDAHVHIVTVVDHDDCEEDAYPALEAAEAALGCFPARVTKETAQGDSTSEIVDVLLRIADIYADVDFIAVGASGQSAVARFFLGSVAESIARHARQPVLITRSLSSPLREIIIGVDGSECSRAAAEFASLRLQFPPDCTLRLAHVVPESDVALMGYPLYPSLGAKDYVALATVKREARSKAHLQAEEVAETLRTSDDGPKIAVEQAAVGNPAEELMRMAEKRGAGLIVVGSQGLTGIDRFLLGSVSERVMRHAHCSVLVVKQPLTEKYR